MAPLRGFAALCVPAVLAFTGEDHSAWVQQHVSVHKDAAKPRRSPKQSPEDMEQLQAAGDMISGIIKDAVKKKPKGAAAHKVKPTHAPKMTAEERSLGPATKKALNSNLQVLLKALNVPALMRGTVTSTVLDEVMKARKTMPATSRAFIDHVLTIDFSGLSTASMDDKFDALAKGLHEAGMETPANLLDAVIPASKVVHYMQNANLSNLNFKTVPKMIRDITGLVPQAKPHKPLLMDVANLMEGNYQKHLTANQVIKDLPMETNTEAMQLLGDYIYLLRDLFQNQQGRAADVGELLRDVKLKPLGDFVQDVPSLKNAGLSELTQRTARLVDEAELMNSTQLDDTFDALDASAQKAQSDREKTEELSDNLLQGFEDTAKDMIRHYGDLISNGTRLVEDGLMNLTMDSERRSKILGNSTKNIWALAQKTATSTVSTLRSKLNESVVELQNVLKAALAQELLVTRWVACRIKPSLPVYQELCSRISQDYPTFTKLFEKFALPDIPVTASLPGIVSENMAFFWASVEDELASNPVIASLRSGSPDGTLAGSEVLHDIMQEVEEATGNM